jgi:arginine utilization protein RocB
MVIAMANDHHSVPYDNPNLSHSLQPQASATDALLRESAAAAIGKILTKLVENDPDVMAAIVEAAKTIAIQVAKTSSDDYAMRARVKDAIEEHIRRLLATDKEWQDKMRADVKACVDAEVAKVAGEHAAAIVARAVKNAVDNACRDLRLKIGDWK